MPLDALVARAVARELDARLSGARISRIFQPRATALELECYRRDEAGGHEYCLFVSVAPDDFRCHLVEGLEPHPPAPPAFCMLLRKYLEGARVTGAGQRGLDRILELRVARSGPQNHCGEFTLVLELTGRHSNVVLVGPDGRVLDALRRARPAPGEPGRGLAPGLEYEAPAAGPAAVRLDETPAGGWEAVVARLADEASRGEGGVRGPAWRRLMEAVEGLGPVVAREVLHRSGLAPDAPAGELSGRAAPLARTLSELAEQVRAAAFEPTVYLGAGGRVLDVGAVALTHLPAAEVRSFPTMNQALAFYATHLVAHRHRAEGRRLIAQALARAVGRAAGTLEKQRADLVGARDHERWRLFGELLMANLHRFPRAGPSAGGAGLSQVEVTNYHDPELPPVTIPLDPSLSPADNAARYFERYRKARRTVEAVGRRMNETRAELEYLRGVEAALALAEDPSDLADVAAELREQGIPVPRLPWEPPAPPRRPGARAAPEHPSCLRYVGPGGYEILVGKNNRQNEVLTLRVAGPDDWWLHARDYPGAHVICRPDPRGGSDPRQEEAAIVAAARLAAACSAARQSSRVAVDATRRRHVRKPRGSRPGFVVYDHHRTLTVEPLRDPEAAGLVVDVRNLPLGRPRICLPRRE